MIAVLIAVIAHTPTTLNLITLTPAKIFNLLLGSLCDKLPNAAKKGNVMEKSLSQMQREWFEQIQIARAVKKVSRGVVARELNRR